MKLILWGLALFGLVVLARWAWARGAPFVERAHDLVVEARDWMDQRAGYLSGPTKLVYPKSTASPAEAITEHMPQGIVYEPGRKGVPVVALALVSLETGANFGLEPDCCPAVAGRALGCPILVKHPSVSKEHVTIFAEGKIWKIRDHSTNGTFINGQRTGFKILELGDRIRFAANGPTLVVRRMNGVLDTSPLHPVPADDDKTQGTDYENAGDWQ